MHQGWLEDGEKKYYTGGSGIPLTGRQKIESAVYWFNEQGVLRTDLRGWQNVDGRWYHFEETTGEQLIGFQEKTEGEDIGW
ncbi:cell wall protein, partial [Subdoligranulum sp. TF05-17AC]